MGGGPFPLTDSWEPPRVNLLAELSRRCGLMKLQLTFSSAHGPLWMYPVSLPELRKQTGTGMSTLSDIHAHLI